MSASAADAWGTREKLKALYEASAAGDLQAIEAACAELGLESLRDVTDANARTPAHFAASHGHLPALELLLGKFRVAADKLDDAGETCLTLAARNGHLDVVEYLLKDGRVGVNLAGQGKQAPLHAAAEAGNAAVLGQLLAAGADPRQGAASGAPLHYAAGHGHTAAARQLLAAGAEPDAADPSGLTPLHLAAAASSAPVAAALLENRAAVNGLAGVGESGFTPLDIAEDAGAAELCALLRKHGGVLADTGDTPGPEGPCGRSAEPAGASSAPLDQFDLAILDHQVEVPAPEGEEDPQGAQAEKAAGDEAYRRGDHKAAVAAYTRGLQRDTHSAKLWLNRSAAALAKGDATMALQDARCARSLDPSLVKAFYREGKAAEALGQPEYAAHALFHAYRLQPDNEELAAAFKAAVDRAKGAVQGLEGAAK